MSAMNNKLSINTGNQKYMFCLTNFVKDRIYPFIHVVRVQETFIHCPLQRTFFLKLKNVR